MSPSRLSRAVRRAAWRVACAAGLGCGLAGCVDLVARTPAATLLTPLSSAIGMGLGADMALRTLQVGTIESAADITPEEQAHFEALDCTGLHEMAGLYAPSGTGLPAADTYAMRAVGARQALLAQLQRDRAC